MNPRLIAIAGPLKGVIYRLSEGEISIGREPFNQFCISDPAVSRQHCTFSRADDQITLTDLDSRNGTFVNDTPIKQRPLAHGDSIRISDHHFIFLLHDDETAAAPAAVQLDDAPPPDGATILIDQEAYRRAPQSLLAALPATARLTRELNALLQVSAAVNEIRKVEELQRRLLELIFEIIPAERGAVLLGGGEAEEFASVYGWNREQSAPQPIQVSRTIIKQVLGEGVAVLRNEVLAHPDAGVAPSLVAARVSSLVAVPLLRFERALGVIYLDTGNPAVKFDEDHLRWLTALAGTAAAAFEQAQHVALLEAEAQRLREEINLAHGMIGESRAMRDVYQLIAKAAPTNATVLIRGESGTGKELVARAIHQNSPRANKPFVAINCAALTETLLESELFGHEKGAFTGAIAQKKGKLEVADGGTVFLDEMGEIAPPLQARLLRVLQEREFERVGGTRTIKVDIRVIAATNRDLEAAIKQGGFRQDLYYRLNVVALTLPPLRERREDIPLLASYFAAKYAQACKRTVRGLASEARATLIAYDWPGNVRELENAIERAVVLGTTELIQVEDLPEALLETVAPATGATSYYETLKETKRRLVQQALAEAQGNFSAAAQLLGMHVNNLHRLMRNLDLKTNTKR